MEPTSLETIMKENCISFLENAIEVKLQPSWIIPGEDRLSYTAIIRLVECCREYHWKKDIEPNAKEFPVDSITKIVTGKFFKPIHIESIIVVEYFIVNVRKRGYTIKFIVLDKNNQNIYSEIKLVEVFYDDNSRAASYPPNSLKKYLDKNCYRKIRGNVNVSK